MPHEQVAKPTWQGNYATGTRDRVGGIAISHQDGTSTYMQPGEDASYLADALDGASPANIDVLLCDQLEGLEPGDDAVVG